MGKLSTDPRCPKCLKILNGFASFGESDRGPESGDFSICMYCLTILEFENGAWKIPTEAPPADVVATLEQFRAFKQAQRAQLN